MFKFIKEWFNSSFDDFMWKKTAGKFKSMNTTSYGGVSVSSDSVKSYQRNLKILKKHGVDYPDWKKAKEVLNEYERSSKRETTRD